MGNVCAQMCVERKLCSIVVVTPAAVEVWLSLWWNDRRQKYAKGFGRSHAYLAGSGEAEIVPNRAWGSGDLMTSWRLG
jgi:hypothetical protein